MIAVLMITTLTASTGYLGYKYYQLKQTNATLATKYSSIVAFADACAKRILDIEKDNSNLTSHIKDSLENWKSPKKQIKTQPKPGAIMLSQDAGVSNAPKPKRKFKNWKPRAADKK